MLRYASLIFFPARMQTLDLTKMNHAAELKAAFIKKHFPLAQWPEVLKELHAITNAHVEAAFESVQ